LKIIYRFKLKNEFLSEKRYKKFCFAIQNVMRKKVIDQVEKLNKIVSIGETHGSIRLNC